MNRKGLVLSVWAVFLFGAGSLAGDDPVEKRLAEARKEFDKAVEKAREGLLAALNKKKDAAKQAGDLKTLGQVQVELEAFEKTGELPKSVPVEAYQGQLAEARARLQDSYDAAIKQYTEDGQINLAKAKAIVKELAKFRMGGPGAVWEGTQVTRGTEFPITLTLSKVDGEAFEGTLRWKFEGVESVCAVAGTVGRESATFNIKSVEKGDAYSPVKYTGRVSGDTVAGEWVFEAGERSDRGTFRLTFPKPGKSK